MVQQAFELLTELEQNSSSNAKKDILTKGSSNEYFKRLFYYAYNPFLKYNVVKYGDVNPSGTGEPTIETFEKFIQLLEALNKRIFTGHEAIGLVNTFFNSLTPEEYKWYSRTLLKDLRVGVTESTVNKVWKNHIPVFECMLATPWHKVKKKPNTVYVEPKLDGYRAVCFVYDDGSVELYTRNGKLIEGFSQVEAELALLPKGMVYDGELIGKNDAFKDMQKLVMKKDDNNKEAYLNIFDALPIVEFNAGKSVKKLSERKEWLVAMFQTYGVQVPDLRLVEFSGPMLPSDPRVDELYHHYLDLGYEGIMVKDTVSLYECKRSTTWAKIKPTDTFDLEVVGYEEGTGKNVGKLGALIVEYNGFKVNVGSGYSDQQREDFWARREELIGQVIEIEAQETTENQKGGQSLRFPIFKRFRHDK